MDIQSILANLIFIIFPLAYGSVIFVSDPLIPVVAIILAISIFREKASGWVIFLSFVASFTVFRILISYAVEIMGISLETLQYVGLFFLTLFGLMMIFPQYALWNKVENPSLKGSIYTILLGFIWSFWVGIFHDFPTDYYEPKWLVLFSTLFSSIAPGIILVLLANYLPSAPYIQVKRTYGIATIIIAMLLLSGIITITPRQGFSLLLEKSH